MSRMLKHCSLRGWLLACSTLVLWGGSAPGALAQSVDFGGSTYTNNGLVGVGRVAAGARDLLGDTLSLGSGLVMDLTTWRRNGDSYSGVLFGLPDRGWNTNGSVDYQARLQRFMINLSPYEGAAALPSGPAQQNQLGLALTQTLGLTDGNGTPTTGLDANGTRAAGGGFPVLPTGRNGRVTLDSEGVVRSRDGSFWVSDEYGPGIYRFNAQGQMLGAIRPPNALIPIRNGVENYSSNNPPAGGAAPVPANPVTGRQNNQGYEGLAISPDGRTLSALLQSATRQDGGDNAATRYTTRLLSYDISDPATPKLVREVVLRLPQFTNAQGQRLVAAQSELLQLNSTQYLMLTRDAAVGFSYADPTSVHRVINIVDVSGATNIAGTVYDGTTPVAPAGVLAGNVTPASVQAFLNINDNTQLNRFGLRNGGPNDRNTLYEKWEGLALVPVLDKRRPNDFFLIVASDNDFITTNGSMQGRPYAEANDVDTVVLVYRVTLPTYIDPLALQSLEVTALPLARATGETALQVARSVLGQADARVFGLRTQTADLAPGQDRRFNTYVTGAFNFDRQDGSGGAYAYGPGGTTGRASADPTVRVATVGGDARITPNLRLGLSVSYFDSTTNLLGNSRIDGTGGAVSPYVTGTFGATWVDAQYSYLFGSWDIRRDTMIYGLTGRAKPDGQGHLLQLSAGHNFATGPLVLGPTGRFTYSHMRIDGYTERDAILANASVPRQEIRQAVLNLGGQVSWPLQFDGLRVVPQLRAGYDIGLTDDDRNLTIGLAERASMAEARVTGPVGTLHQSGFRGGAGVVFRRENLSLLLDYDVRTRAYGTADHLLTVSLGAAF